MLKRLPVGIMLLSLVLGACGSGIDEGDDLTDEQKMMVALEGTWIGTADSFTTISGTDRIVIEMSLPSDGKPRLEGLSGTIWVGDELDTSEVDPDDPGLEHAYIDNRLREGCRFELMNIAIVSARILMEFQSDTQWTEFCEAQTEIYHWSESNYSCTPYWWETHCDGSGICVIKPPGEEDISVTRGKIDLCERICDCDATSCTVEQLEKGDYELDITVDIENGVMLGEGLGRIEAIKQ